jgi:hypothetical protein
MRLPDVYVQNPPDYAFFPHVAWSGQVCYNDGQSVNIDTSVPERIVEHVVSLAADILDSNEASVDAFWDEFEGYWNHQKNRFVCICMFDPSDAFEVLEARVDQDDRPSIVYAPPWNDSYPSDIGNSAYWNNGVHVTYYCPLTRQVGFPQPGSRISIAELQAAIAAMSEENQLEFHRARLGGSSRRRQRRNKRPLNIIFSTPRPSGGRSLFAVSVPYGNQVLDGNPELFEDGAIPGKVQRLTHVHTTRRCGGEISLGDFRVGVIGVGSLGSAVTELLVTSGIKNLHLIDGDVFTPDNLYRHTLPPRYFGQKKVTALSKYLRSRYPDINAEPDFRYAFNCEYLRELELDALVVAVGNPTLERAISAELPVPILVTTWLEALGLGGHAVLDDSKLGCLNCLYHRDGTPVLSSVTAMIEPGQPVTRNLTGCEGSFVPFGSIDVSQTAVIASRLLTNRLLGQATQKYCFWCGPETVSERHGIETTDWFRKCKSDKARSEIQGRFDTGCPVCASRTSAT